MSDITVSEYCRQLEAYLCRRNDGHLIRIVGPVFEMVAGWHARGIPLKVAFKGVDRKVDRERAKGPGRRPIRMEFCEADVLDAFDEWRRAVGAGMAPPESAAVGTDAQPSDDGAPVAAVRSRTRTVPLRAHIDRAMARLTQCRVESTLPEPLGSTIDATLAELDGVRTRAKGARGAVREELVALLQRLDAALVRAAAESLPAQVREGLQREAARELQPFATRMTREAFAEAVQAAAARLTRDAWRLPDLAAGL